MRDVERRFATTMREADRHDPGLVMEDDGTVWLVAPGGDRAELGGGGGSAGAALPTADPVGATVDTSTYDNPIGSGKLATLVFPQDTAAFAIALEGDDYPRWVFGADPNNGGLSLGDGTFDPVGGGAAMFLTGGGHIGFDGYDPRYVPPTAKALLSGDPATIVDGGTADLTFDTRVSGDELFDIVSNPANPEALVSGTFAISVTVGPSSSMPPGGWYHVEVSDVLPNTFTLRQDALASAANSFPAVTVSFAHHFVAGEKFKVNIDNHAGSSCDYEVVQAIVQRIT